MKKKTKAELKELLVQATVSLAKARVPDGHCPYAVLPGNGSVEACDDCAECAREFFRRLEKETRKKVAAL